MAVQTRIREHVDNRCVPVYFATCEDCAPTPGRPYRVVGAKHWSRILSVADIEEHLATSHGGSKA